VGSTQPGSSAKKLPDTLPRGVVSWSKLGNRVPEGAKTRLWGDTEQRCNRRLGATVFRRRLRLNLHKYWLSTFYKY
jgi:hypothetical protein